MATKKRAPKKAVARKPRATVKKAAPRRRPSSRKESPLVAIAMGIGGAFLANYALNSAPVIKMVPSATTRALIVAGIGVAGAMYAPKAAMPLLAGVAIGGGVVSIQLLTAPKGAAVDGAAPIGRLTASDVAMIKDKVRQANYRLNGIPRGVIMGPGNGGNIPKGVIVGAFDPRMPGTSEFA